MDFSQLMSLASGHVEARVVQTAVELNIFDALQLAPLTGGELANSLGLDPQASELFLNALTALTLLHKDAGKFSLSDIAQQFLVRGSPHYLGGMIHFDASLWRCWEMLDQSLRSGKPVRPANMYQAEREETETFINGMDSLVKARGDCEILAEAIDWRNVTDLLDIGSGPATYPIFLCRRFDQMSVTIFDLPGTLDITEKFVREAGITPRIKLIAGDYRKDPIPGSYDVIFLSNIIHGENEQKNQALIGKLAENLKPAGRIVIKDHILDQSRAYPPVGAIFSMLMLLTTDGGRCYSLEEISAWLKSAGLAQIEQRDLPPPLTSSLVIASR
ncbi:MAG TPA: methyltransferase [Candidatus Binatia bacterium]